MSTYTLSAKNYIHWLSKRDKLRRAKVYHDWIETVACWRNVLVEKVAEAECSATATTVVAVHFAYEQLVIGDEQNATAALLATLGCRLYGAERVCLVGTGVRHATQLNNHICGLWNYLYRRLDKPAVSAPTVIPSVDFIRGYLTTDVNSPLSLLIICEYALSDETQWVLSTLQRNGIMPAVVVLISSMMVDLAHNLPLSLSECKQFRPDCSQLMIFKWNAESKCLGDCDRIESYP